MIKPIIEFIVKALGRRDQGTRQHCERVSDLCGDIAKEMGMSKREQYLIRLAGAAHDIGKIGINDSILLKEGKLTDHQMKIMKAHSLEGASMVEDIMHEDAEIISSIIRHHHENYDGSGYPDGLKGDAIPIMSRIMRVADSYDAACSKRPYSHPKPHESVEIELLNDHGRFYDPDVVSSFVKIVWGSEYRSKVGDTDEDQ